MSLLRTGSSEALQPQNSVTYLEPPVSPTPINAPAQSAPAPAPPPAPVPAAVQSPAPVAPVQPAAPAQPVVPDAPPRDETVAIFLHLTSGERLWAGRFDNGELAERRASEIVHALIRPEPGVWPKYGNRLIRPEAVVSIEFAHRREDS